MKKQIETIPTAYPLEPDKNLSVSGNSVKIVFLGTYLPRKCGIATYTHDLRESMAKKWGGEAYPVIAMNNTLEVHPYPPEVVHQIADQDIASYERAAEYINHSQTEVVCLQHEFGIFGGQAGSHVNALMLALEVPVVTTLHTVLRDPEPGQRRVMETLITLSERVVVMTEKARRLLLEVYSAPAQKIDLIAHGIHDVPFADPETYKNLFAVEGCMVLLTFGLLSPNKGIEHVINALPGIIERHPKVVYLVLGATHPNMLRDQGETYRIGLERLAKQKGVDQHVIFYNRFVGLEELTDFIGAADVYITPYLNEQQIVSGTLAYAFGAGKAVISTPYWHAVELLAGGRGVLVPFADSGAIEREICALLEDGPRRLAMRRKAYETGREMIWPRAADHYRESLVRARNSHATMHRQAFTVRTLAQETISLPSFKPDHILRMTDCSGILQHAQFTLPNYAHGYCTDDNARALILVLLWRTLGESFSGLDELKTRYAAFVAHAFDSQTKRFRNFMGYDHRWLEEEGSEDAQGRALWALGVGVEQTFDRGLSLLAEHLFDEALKRVGELTHPRTWAFVLLGIGAYLRRHPEDERAKAMRSDLTDRIMSRFADHAREDWHWFADDATYGNARMPQALILSGRAMQQPPMIDVGLRTLRWLVRMQTSDSGCFQPIGSDGFCHRNGHRAFFDQQPIDVQTTVSACLEAYRTTANDQWLMKAHVVFEWFLGRNDLGVMVYDARTGGCFDGLHVDRVNENQGAESTIAFHLALAELRQVHNTLTTFNSLLAVTTEP